MLAVGLTLAVLTILSSMRDIRNALGPALAAVIVVFACGLVRGQEPWHFIFPEQRRLEIRDPSQIRPARIPDMPPPRTVDNVKADAEAQRLSLDDAIRTSLQNTDVVRILAGVTAVASGQTIYDPAIQNTQIDTARATFDPTFHLNNNFFRTGTPGAGFDESVPPRVVIGSLPSHFYDMQMGLSKNTVTGGSAALNVRATPTKDEFDVDPLNPRTPSSAELRFTQPLLQGAGVRVNMAPIVIARIDTERSFFQLKDSLQQSVRGVVEGYWSLMQARVEAWARQQQVQQGQEALEYAQASRDAGRGTAADVAQARAALANFVAARVTADANVIQREAALRNLLGLPPPGATPIVPVTPMSTARVDPNWNETLRLAEQRRPDLIELKLILEADDQRLLVAKNQALPRVDALAVYRWNGLEGRLPVGSPTRTAPGDFTE